MGSDAESQSLDSPCEARIKEQLMAMPPGVLAVSHIMRLRLAEPCGLVSWDSCAPSNVPAWKHMDSLALAIATGLGFCGTDMRGEWVLLGHQTLIIVRCLPLFKCFPEPYECAPLCYIGTLATTNVYIPMAEHQIIMNRTNEFYMGTGNKVARGIILNSSVNFADGAHD